MQGIEIGSYVRVVDTTKEPIWIPFIARVIKVLPIKVAEDAKGLAPIPRSENYLVTIDPPIPLNLGPVNQINSDYVFPLTEDAEMALAIIKWEEILK